MPGETGRPGERHVLAHAGWSPAKPEKLPRRTLWPAVAALGIVLVMWGVVTAYLIAAVGVVLLGMAVLGWTGELLHER
ncbi:MAG: hypothetical protein E6H03_09030 [Bacillati bacterium ANGP1]|uniref:Cytochrome aa3 subunit 4 n=1 Tax=Candidatus Segetimicrobium genomatis TaxID=2569760 RepID=A0A537J990_9BACT|nr:MAG: hypothetical protein E6H03_09030 [Terrabacteria group bacterium ANGP1]